MSLFDYFQKVETDKIDGFHLLTEGQIGNQINLNPTSIEEYDIVFFDIEEEREQKAKEISSIKKFESNAA